jgi:hypothetical protein
MADQLPHQFQFRVPFGISFAFGVALSLENRFQWMKDFGAAAFTRRLSGATLANRTPAPDFRVLTVVWTSRII